MYVSTGKGEIQLRIWCRFGKTEPVHPSGHHFAAGYLMRYGATKSPEIAIDQTDFDRVLLIPQNSPIDKLIL